MVTKPVALPPPWNERMLKIFRSLAGIGMGFTAILTLSQNDYVRGVLHNGHLPSLINAVKLELSLQAFTVFCLLGFVLETLPAVREDRWFERANDPAVAKFFGAMESEERQQRLRNTITAATQFRGCWIFLWATWFLLYVVWRIEWVIAPPTETLAINIFTVVGDTLNLLTASAFTLCYYVMTRHTAPPPRIGFLPLVFFTTAGFILIGLVGLFYLGQPKEVLDPVHWLSGLVSGIAMALFVGRLESGLMRINPFLIVAYYAYAIIQFSYSDLSKHLLLFLVMTSAALALKILLFWELRKILSGGTIYWYMFEYRKDLEVGKEDKQEFLAAFLAK